MCERHVLHVINLELVFSYTCDVIFFLNILTQKSLEKTGGLKMKSKFVYSKLKKLFLKNSNKLLNFSLKTLSPTSAFFDRTSPQSKYFCYCTFLEAAKSKNIFILSNFFIIDEKHLEVVYYILLCNFQYCNRKK